MLGLDYRRNTKKPRKARSHNPVILFFGTGNCLFGSVCPVTSEKAADSATITRGPLFQEIWGDFWFWARKDFADKGDWESMRRRQNVQKFDVCCLLCKPNPFLLIIVVFNANRIQVTNTATDYISWSFKMIEWYNFRMISLLRSVGFARLLVLKFRPRPPIWTVIVCSRASILRPHPIQSFHIIPFVPSPPLSPLFSSLQISLCVITLQKFGFEPTTRWRRLDLSRIAAHAQQG